MNDSYVVQIYRRDTLDPSRLTGTVERIGNGQQRAFSSMTELWAYLAADPLPRRRGGEAHSDTAATNRRKS